MESKTVKISELLDDYTDNEFCIEGETEVQNEEIKDIVLKKAKKRVKPAKKIIIAAVAAAAALTAVMGAAAQRIIFTGLDGTDHGYYIDVNGNEYKYHHSSNTNMEAVVLEENGRLYLTADGGKTDITDLIDEETPYIYKCHDQPADVDNAENYIVIGGTPNEYGYDSYTLFDGEWGMSYAVRTIGPNDRLEMYDWEINGMKQLQSEGRLVGLDIEQIMEFSVNR